MDDFIHFQQFSVIVKSHTFIFGPIRRYEALSFNIINCISKQMSTLTNIILFCWQSKK